MRVLVVDDDESIVRALSALLQKDGHDVVGYTNPLNAAQEVGFEVVITDFSMPSIDGVALLERLRETNPYARRYMMTAYEKSSVVNAAEASGLVEHVFLKPWRIEDIRSVIGLVRSV